MTLSTDSFATLQTPAGRRKTSRLDTNATLCPVLTSCTAARHTVAGDVHKLENYFGASKVDISEVLRSLLGAFHAMRDAGNNRSVTMIRRYFQPPAKLA